MAERWGAKRPKTDGPMRMPPIISPITRAWPTLSASQPQAHRDQQDDRHLGQQQGHEVLVLSAGQLFVVLPGRSPDGKLLLAGRLSAFETLLFLSFHLAPGILPQPWFPRTGQHAPTFCAARTGLIVQTTICCFTTSTFASIRRRSFSRARTPSASGCSRTAGASSWICTPRSRSTRYFSVGFDSGTQRDSGAVFIDFPETLKAGREYTIDFYYSGHPVETGRFGAITFRKDPAGHPWINTACEETGASVWWPNKDQWRDEVEEHGDQRVRFPTAWSMSPTENSWARPTWATATRAGIGWSITPSTTTTSL